VAIAAHPDVRRQLAALDAEAAVLTALVCEVAVALAEAKAGDADAAARAAFLLPLAKTFGGEGGFAAASGALQVLGGAGYTKDWPVERLLRDARIMTIYEGTTGMQAQDFVLRRLLRDEGRGLAAWAARAREEVEEAPGGGTVLSLLARFEALAEGLAGRAADDLLAAADGVLRAGWVAVSATLAHRDRGAGPDPCAGRPAVSVDGSGADGARRSGGAPLRGGPPLTRQRRAAAVGSRRVIRVAYSAVAPMPPSGKKCTPARLPRIVARASARRSSTGVGS
jgi:hypothetical protein